MNYIGSKHKLVPFIKDTVHRVVGEDLSGLVFCDLFAGTGIVGRNFKPLVKKLIANDIEFYSYTLLKNYIGNSSTLDFQPYLDILNNVKPREGFIFQQYSENGSAGRLYFSEENGKKIDAARQQIEIWKNENTIGESLYFFLLASLLESADKIANTASVYGAFLKRIKATAQKKLQIQPAIFELSENQHQVYRADANALIQQLEGDILYLDPPYNARQYGANYHLLNTIAKYDTFSPRGKTGLRLYYKSAYCKRGEVLQNFEKLLENAYFKYVFFSYNNEGLMRPSEIKSIMARFGKYDLVTKDYQRFKADKTENRNHTANKTTEFLHILEKR